MRRGIAPSDLAIQRVELLLCDDVCGATNFNHLRLLQVGRKVLDLGNHWSLSFFVNPGIADGIFGVKLREFVLQDVSAKMEEGKIPRHHDGSPKCLVAEADQSFAQEVPFG